MMERLTDERSKTPIDQSGGMCVTAKFINRLAAYEDTGLEPEEINALAEYYTKLKSGEYILKDDHLRELLEAEEDGRVVVLPEFGMDIGNPLEPLKVISALKSEIMKYEFRAKNNPEDLSVLDYTIIKALEDVLTRETERKQAEAAPGGDHR